MAHRPLRAYAACRRSDPGAPALAAEAFELCRALGLGELPFRKEPEAAETLLPLAIAAGSSAAVELAATARRVTITLLGGFELRRGRSELAPPAGRPYTAVRAVAVAGGRMQAEELTELLRPGADPSVGRNRLKNLLSRLRAAVGDVLLREGDSVVLAPECECDMEHFEREVREALRARSDGHHLRAAGLARSALDRYKGDLLPSDRYEPWAATARERLRMKYLDVQHVTPTTAAAPGATWQLGFVTTTDLQGARSALTLEGPAGTSFSSVSSVHCWDDTVPRGVSMTRSSYRGLQVQGRDADGQDAAYAATVVTPVALTASKSESQLTFPAGSALNAACQFDALNAWNIFDDTTGAFLGDPFGGCVHGSTASTEILSPASDVAAGDELTVLGNHVGNAGSSGTLGVAVSATGGSAPGFTALGSFQVGLTSRTATSTPVVRGSSVSAEASGVTYVVAFTLTNGINSFSSLQVSFPPGTIFSPGASYFLDDVDAVTSESGGMTASGSVATIDLADAGGAGWFAAGQELRIVLTGWTIRNKPPRRP